MERVMISDPKLLENVNGGGYFWNLKDDGSMTYEVICSVT